MTPRYVWICPECAADISRPRPRVPTVVSSTPALIPRSSTVVRESSEELTQSRRIRALGDPEMTVHPIGQTRAHPTERDDRASIKFVDPHFIFEKPEQLGLREFERINVGGTLSILRTGFAIHPNTERNARPHKNQRKKECLAESGARTRSVQVRPSDSRCSQGHAGVRTTLNKIAQLARTISGIVMTRGLSCGVLEGSTPVTEEDVDDLPRHVERGEDDAGQQEIIGQARSRPVRGHVQDFLLRPTAGKKERHAAEGHHADCIS